ncbi:MAG: hypothetical protein ACD_19C00176G0039 [uncultured bacterium]|nr:MAG: hypothetical protein ACD_19C00176G0039 [uncultured bacterium]
MHEEILEENQRSLLALVSKFSPQFGLVGGTAIALHLGHRRSIDFDLFTGNDFDTDKIRTIIRQTHIIQEVIVNNPNELTIIIDNVKVTFYKYPFDINFSMSFSNIINIPDLLTLSAMKAFALGKRAKWKDYVDLYFIFKEIDFKKVVVKAEKLFLTEFNEKLFREQLSYFSDIDRTEDLIYIKGFDVPDIEIEKSLINVSLQK